MGKRLERFGEVRIVDEMNGFTLLSVDAERKAPLQDFERALRTQNFLVSSQIFTDNLFLFSFNPSSR